MNSFLRGLRWIAMLFNGLLVLGICSLIAESRGLQFLQIVDGTFLYGLAMALFLVAVILVFIPYGAAILIIDLFMRWKDPTPRSWLVTLALPLLTLAVKYLFYTAVVVYLTLT